MNNVRERCRGEVEGTGCLSEGFQREEDDDIQHIAHDADGQEEPARIGEDPLGGRLQCVAQR